MASADVEPGHTEYVGGADYFGKTADQAADKSSS
jgi:hypothetical protein